MKDWDKLLLDSNRMTGASKTLALAHNELVRSIYGPLLDAPEETDEKTDEEGPTEDPES